MRSKSGYSKKPTKTQQSKKAKKLSNIQEEAPSLSSQGIHEDSIDYEEVASLFRYVKLMGRVIKVWRYIPKRHEVRSRSITNTDQHPGFKFLQNSINEVKLLRSNR